MKIVAISGSPRKGNTYSALKGIKESNSEIDLQIISLKEKNLEMCRGCYVCVLKGEDKCPLSDDRNAIMQAVKDADALILAYPVYSHMITSLMKNFIDRVSYLAHRPCFFNKFAMTMTTYSGYGTEEATKYMEKMLRVFGFSLAPSVELLCAPGKKSEEAEKLNKLKTQEAFDKLTAKIESGDREKPSLNMLVPFGVFKHISEIGRKVMTADYEYYKNKGDYYYEVQIPFHKKYIARKVISKITAGFNSGDI